MENHGDATTIAATVLLYHSRVPWLLLSGVPCVSWGLWRTLHAVGGWTLDFGLWRDIVAMVNNAAGKSGPRWGSAKSVGYVRPLELGSDVSYLLSSIYIGCDSRRKQEIVLWMLAVGGLGSFRGDSILIMLPVMILPCPGTARRNANNFSKCSQHLLMGPTLDAAVITPYCS